MSRIESIPGDVKFLDKIPLAQYEQRSTLKMGQTNGHKYMRPALNGRIEKERSTLRSLSLAHTHRLTLRYQNFRDKKDGCIKIVMTP